jgi:hypothetical protein
VKIQPGKRQIEYRQEKGQLVPHWQRAASEILLCRLPFDHKKEKIPSQQHVMLLTSVRQPLVRRAAYPPGKACFEEGGAKCK